MMTNAVERDVKSWVDASRYDLETARALLASRRYLYVLFMCQQSLEKLLKAYVTARTKEFPPRIHDLVRLVELCSIEFPEEQEAFLERLSRYYIQTRYPSEIRSMAKRVGRSIAKTHLRETESLWAWLRRRLTPKK